MKRVTGIGGIFFKAKDPEKLAAWYKKHLGVELQGDTMSIFEWKKGASKARPGSTVWTVMPKASKYFKPSKSPFMINYRVDDLVALVKQLRKERVKVEPPQDSEYGKFAWVMDPEGNRVELWEPPAGS
jgi:predicted enzyme related to lactoylglutathione lyase